MESLQANRRDVEGKVLPRSGVVVGYFGLESAKLRFEYVSGDGDAHVGSQHIAFCVTDR